jgi:hypothetical protein
MTRITRGFHGRRRPDVDPARVPPGQYLTQDFPVLSAGPTPHGSLDSWSFTIRGQVDHRMSWSFQRLWAAAGNLRIAASSVGPIFAISTLPRSLRCLIPGRSGHHADMESAI